ncbi:SpoIIE family protein phosphatase [Methylomicrobium sp. Wu6]|uniref:PP2C family protein-serine/threonine phosphatase n=1 Tax=Methylomicrobium sp. Wu6 TaxID=3107928 RepID=UPI002DD619F2|nr:SpoIIE family protein phosphatase [Methylomicrobium sp. Wu6]MEC4747094.1 SpoIIE family protein phosphatase [Methylomicrobium sp. Wu6]
MPNARELTLTVESITLEAQVLDILDLFQARSSLVALPLIDNNRKYFGTLSRRSFLNFMTRAYSRELYARKSIAALLDSNPGIFTAPLIVDAEDRIDQVILDFLNSDPAIISEALPVMEGESVIGIVTIADMMLSLSESQGKLIDTMEQLSTRLKEEVDGAATLQRNLLRPSHIDLPGLRGLSTLITSSEVGGDFYDYYTVDGRWVVMLVGDVSGHGVASGTMVSAAKAGVNLLEAGREREPRMILSRLNETLYKTARQSLLMTMFAISLDTQTGELRYANAGHQFAYLYRAALGSLDVLELGGLPLGKNEHIDYEQGITEMDVGDRLFLYTDGIVEEENSSGEYFGYDRLEELLTLHAESDAETVRDEILACLTSHVGRRHFNDDVTIFQVEHHERQQAATKTVTAASQDYELVRIVEAFYRANPNAISSRLVRQNLVFLAEAGFSDLIPGLSAQGIRRVIMRHQPIVRHLGWDNLLRQHQNVCNDDLAAYLRNPQQHREFEITHSDDKAFIIGEVEAWLQEMDLLDPDRLDSVVLLLDELIENGLYAAPRDGKGRPLYAKGTARSIAGENLILRLSIQDGLLGISFTDNWGTLTPAIFLNRLSRHMQGRGLDAGMGGGGLYLIWRMADYLQLRVFPHRHTQVCAFLDLKSPFDPESDKSFQFLYHTELHEIVKHDEPSHTANSAATVG